MAVLFYSGAESGSAPAAAVNHAAEGGSAVFMQALTTAPIIQSGALRTGVGSYYLRAASNVISACRIAISTVDNRTYWMGMAFRISTASPSVATRILLRNDYEVRITTSRTLELRVGGVTIGSASAALTLGTTYYVEMGHTANSAGNDYAEAWLDGVSFASSSGTNLSTLLGNNFDFGPNTTAYGATVVMEWDDMYICDDQGSAPVNTRLNQPEVLASLPASDVSRDASWVDNDLSTTNLYQSIDNRPAVGVAPVSGAGTADLMVKNSTSAATANYVTDLQSAITAGVGASDTILATRCISSGGLSSATGATLYSLEVISGSGHPAVAEATFDPNLAAGTWPTNWVVGSLAIQPSPTITDRNVSPRVEIGKRSASTTVTAVAQVRIDWLVVAPTSTPISGSDTNSTTTEAVTQTAAISDTDTGTGADFGSLPAAPYLPKRKPKVYSDAVHRKSRW